MAQTPGIIIDFPISARLGPIIAVGAGKYFCRIQPRLFGKPGEGPFLSLFLSVFLPLPFHIGRESSRTVPAGAPQRPNHRALSNLYCPPPPSSLVQCGSTCRSAHFHLASPDPPSYSDVDKPDTGLVSPILPHTKKRIPASCRPGIVRLLGVHARWHIPLLTCRALSTAPAGWWGFRCAFTFLGELLIGDGVWLGGNAWDVEKRFRVTEVFLAILWVRQLPRSMGGDGGIVTKKRP